MSDRPPGGFGKPRQIILGGDMTRISRVPKSAAVVGAAGIACALTGSILLAAPAMAASSEIVGSATVVLDFSVAGEVNVDLNTQNLSGVTAYGSAYVDAPDGQRYTWGPREYAPGEVWTYTKLLTGYTCDDLSSVSAAAFGYADLEDRTPDWTTGVVSYPDDRVTVIGCDTPPTTPPASTDPVTPPSSSTTPTTTGLGNTLPPSRTDGALLASTGGTSPLGPTLMIGAVGLFTVAAGLVARQRSRFSRAE